MPPHELHAHLLSEGDQLVGVDVGSGEVHCDEHVSHREGVRVLPILPKWSSPPLLRLEGVRTLSTRILWLEHVVCNIEGGHLPLLQVLRGQAEGVLLHLQPPLGLSGDDLALDSDAELWTEELR